MEEKEKYECLERSFKEYQTEFAKQQAELDLIKCGNEQLRDENEQLKQELGNYKLLSAVFGEDKNEAIAREKLIKNQKIVMDGFAKQIYKEQQIVKELKQQLTEKDELLKNAVVPKFKIGDEVWLIEENGLTDKKELMNCKIQRHSIEYKVDGIFSRTWYYDDSLFATKEKAKEAIDLIEENNNAFNKTFEDIKNNAVVFYEKKDKEFLELKKELEIYKKALNNAVETLSLMDGCDYDCNNYLKQAEEALKKLEEV